VHVGVFQSGTARNIIPDAAELRFEVRPLPGAEVTALLKPYDDKVAELLKRYPGSTIVTERLMHVHGLKRDNENAPHLALAAFLAGSNEAP
ncbi:peptidase dimerization domain-containing protein, partial [Staphylococcus aureus]